jgi:hypothetical protein
MEKKGGEGYTHKFETGNKLYKQNQHVEQARLYN